ncbi:tol-pal system YbgF family protein [candidate division KSB1 bacterium]
MNLARKKLLLLLFLLLFAACSAGAGAQKVVSNPEVLAEAADRGELKGNPDTLLELAEYYYGRQKFQESLNVVQKVIADHTGTFQSDYAYYLKGMIYADVLNFNMDLRQAAAAFRMVVSSPPESDFDERAQKELERIKRRFYEQ